MSGALVGCVRAVMLTAGDVDAGTHTFSESSRIRPFFGT